MVIGICDWNMSIQGKFTGTESDLKIPCIDRIRNDRETVVVQTERSTPKEMNPWEKFTGTESDLKIPV